MYITLLLDKIMIQSSSTLNQEDGCGELVNLYLIHVFVD